MHFLSFHFSTIPNSMLLCNCKTPMCRSKMNIFLKKNECHQIILTDAVNWLTKQLFPNLSSLFASHYKKANYVGGDHMTDCWPMRHQNWHARSPNRKPFAWLGLTAFLLSVSRSLELQQLFQDYKSQANHKYMGPNLVNH